MAKLLESSWTSLVGTDGKPIVELAERLKAKELPRELADVVEAVGEERGLGKNAHSRTRQRLGRAGGAANGAPKPAANTKNADCEAQRPGSEGEGSGVASAEGNPDTSSARFNVVGGMAKPAEKKRQQGHAGRVLITELTGENIVEGARLNSTPTGYGSDYKISLLVWHLRHSGTAEDLERLLLHLHQNPQLCTKHLRVVLFERIGSAKNTDRGSVGTNTLERAKSSVLTALKVE